ncbi:uncharacterized protein LY89DRAFT_672201 [Mollisia scopiformis]|uniref:Uncharacterized protein n=1 Tax=Mollisia scopiformis TaxID=149040 RepID=A0A194X167_MOLSC|nr:uncharacterized protein LY89DRAFT_672201 [Mollisia scopiformis]KUJ13935.1 hypothetical protein LY89DRAFT_672201 [Mollisia scopiformis]
MSQCRIRMKEGRIQQVSEPPVGEVVGQLANVIHRNAVHSLETFSRILGKIDAFSARFIVFEGGLLDGIAAGADEERMPQATCEGCDIRPSKHEIDETCTQEGGAGHPLQRSNVLYLTAGLRALTFPPPLLLGSFTVPRRPSAAPTAPFLMPVLHAAEFWRASRPVQIADVQEPGRVASFEGPRHHRPRDQHQNQHQQRHGPRVSAPRDRLRQSEVEGEGEVEVEVKLASVRYGTVHRASESSGGAHLVLGIWDPVSAV